MCLSVPQMPQRLTSRSAASSGTSGSGNVQRLIEPGASITAARTEVLVILGQMPSSLSLDVDPLLVPGRVRDRVHDQTVAVPVEEGGTLGCDRRVLRDGDQKMVELVHERVVPTESASLVRPVLLH